MLYVISFDITLVPGGLAPELGHVGKLGSLPVQVAAEPPEVLSCAFNDQNHHSAVFINWVSLQREHEMCGT